MKGKAVKNLSLKGNRTQAVRYVFCILQPLLEVYFQEYILIEKSSKIY